MGRSLRFFQQIILQYFYSQAKAISICFRIRSIPCTSNFHGLPLTITMLNRGNGSTVKSMINGTTLFSLKNLFVMD
jgi:hypothetical protein